MLHIYCLHRETLYLFGCHPQALQGRAEHGGLRDPVTQVAGLEDQVKMASQQREKATCAISSCSVIYPVIGQHSCQ